MCAGVEWAGSAGGAEALGCDDIFTSALRIRDVPSGEREGMAVSSLIETWPVLGVAWPYLICRSC